MDPNEYAQRVETNEIIAGIINALRDQLAEAQAENVRLRMALKGIADVLLARHQEGWEERLLDIAKAALESRP